MSEETLKRWELGRQLPTPDDVGNIERVLDMRDQSLWHRWMMSHYDSYRERNTTLPIRDNLLENVVRTKHEILDAIALLEKIERDAVDGVIDEPELWQALQRELVDAKDAIRQMVNKIPGKCSTERRPS